MELVEDFEKNMAPVAAITEMSWKEFSGGARAEEAQAAKQREEDAMMKANFHSDTPRLIELTCFYLKNFGS